MPRLLDTAKEARTLSKKERELVTAIRDWADTYLKAANHAEKYLSSRAFVNAVIDFQTYATRQTSSRMSGPRAAA